MEDELFTTEEDVTLDLVAALEEWDRMKLPPTVGTFGGDDVTIEQVTSDQQARTVRLELSNGDVYELRVRKAS